VFFKMYGTRGSKGRPPDAAMAVSGGVFKPMHIWNGDETLWGLDFGDEPVALPVSPATN